MAKPPLTARRLVGLDRSGPTPEQTLPGAPLRPWTIPNAIGYARLALIPVFLAVSFDSPHGRDDLAAVLFAVIAWSDYADGIAARVTGQYSRLGALLDPVVDRLLIISGVVVCFYFDLLPRWAIAVLVGRELLMLALGPLVVRRGVELRINWLGRWAVWPTMSAVFFAIVDLPALARVMLYLGLVLALAATVLYVRSGLAQLRSPPTSSST